MNNYSSSSENNDSSSEEMPLRNSDNEEDDEPVIVDSDDSSLEYTSSFYSDIESDNEYDDINQQDYQHFYSEKEHGKYYIGLCNYHYMPNHIIMASSVSPRIYYDHPNRAILHYLYYYSGSFSGISISWKMHIDIMKLHILEDGTYTVIVKTFWLRLIQRRWKNIYKKRMKCIQKRKRLHSLKYRECNGYWPRDIASLPGLHNIIDYRLLVKCH